MYTDDLRRQDREAELAAEKSAGSKDLNNLIVNDDESNSQMDEELDDFNSEHSKKVKSDMSEDQQESVPPQQMQSIQLGTVDYV
jgi:hypothetical protein